MINYIIYIRNRLLVKYYSAYKDFKIPQNTFLFFKTLA